MNSPLQYRAGYKYQVHADYQIKLNIAPPAFIYTRFIQFDEDGTLYISRGYAWDGPSGPAIDTKNFMVASLVHDALYQLIREHHLDSTVYRELADQALVQLTKEAGMWAPRRWWVYIGVRWGGGAYAQQEDPVYTAP